MPFWSTTTLFVPSAARLPRAAAGKRGIPATPVTIGLRRVDHGACEPVPALCIARRYSIHCCYRGKQARDGVRGVGEHDARAEDGQSTWVLQHMQPVSAAVPAQGKAGCKRVGTHQHGPRARVHSATTTRTWSSLQWIYCVNV